MGKDVLWDVIPSKMTETVSSVVRIHPDADNGYLSIKVYRTTRRLVSNGSYLRMCNALYRVFHDFRA